MAALPRARPPTKEYVTLQRADQRGLGTYAAPAPQVLSRGGGGGGGTTPRSAAEVVPDNLCTKCPCLCNFLSSECWLTGCCAPCAGAFCANCMLLCCGFCPGLPASCYLGLDRVQATLHNQLGLWVMQHPGPEAGCPMYMAGWGLCCGCCGWLGYCLNAYAYADGGAHFVMNGGLKRADARVSYLRHQEWFGDTFSNTGKLCIADTDRVNRMILDTPMDRGLFLGIHPLLSAPMPHYEDDKTKSFPLALPSGKCPMNDGSHATFLETFARLMWNDAARERMRAGNPVVVRAMRELQAEYDPARARFKAVGEPSSYAFVDVFCARMLHWGLFGLDLGAVGSSDFSTAMWASSPSQRVIQYMMAGGGVVNCLSKADTAVKHARLVAMYMGSAALAGYTPTGGLDGLGDLQRADFNGRPPRQLSKEEFVEQLVPAIIIAGLQGPKTLGGTLMASRFGGLPVGPLSTAEERATPQCPPPEFAYPFGDDDKLRLCILEALRLNPAVFETVFLLPEARSVANFAGYGPKEFPKGCPVLLSYVNTGVDEAEFGPGAKSWDPYGRAQKLEGPESRFNGFNGVGARGQRVCPGRELSIVMLIHMLNAIGGRIA